MTLIEQLACAILGVTLGVLLTLSMMGEAQAGQSVPDGQLSCNNAIKAARNASAEVPAGYLAAAVEGVCTGRAPVEIVNVSRRFMDESFGYFAGLTMPVGFGAVEQSAAVIFLTSRGDAWVLLSHELAHVSGWRHPMPDALAELAR